MDVLTLTVEGIEGEIKIRDYLVRHLGFSASIIAKVKYDGVFLNGTPVHMRAMVRRGDEIRVQFPEEESEGIEPLYIPIEVLYEDEHILVVNKPRNMPIHPSRGNSLPTLANAVRAYLDRPFVYRSITRLDRDTSGIVLIAKNQLASAKLSRAMRSGRIKKKYLARVVGIPSPASGTVNAPIEREFEGEMRRVVREDGKPSVTEYSTLSTDRHGSSLVEVRPITGRTHQIRVHMAYIGCPLLGDFLYGERIEGETYRLHCSELIFPHPISGEYITVISKADF